MSVHWRWWCWPRHDLRRFRVDAAFPHRQVRIAEHQPPHGALELVEVALVQILAGGHVVVVSTVQIGLPVS
jgi:hypothetical protein